VHLYLQHGCSLVPRSLTVLPSGLL
jgi:hypothetical protein